jgi:hypothetical protein
MNNGKAGAMNKRPMKPLTVNRETLALLDPEALAKIGAGARVMSDSVPQCCCSNGTGTA